MEEPEMQRRQVPLKKKLIKQLETGPNKDAFRGAISIQDVFTIEGTEG